MLVVEHVVIISILIVPLLCEIAEYNVSKLKSFAGKNGSHVFNIRIHNYNTYSERTVNKSEEDIDRLDFKKEDTNQNATTNITESARFGDGSGGGKGGKKGGFLEKVLPFMVIPFMISSSLIPIALTALKFMVLKSAFIGKMAIILLLINMFLRFNNRGGVYSHNVNLSPFQKEVAMTHYGYNGNEEYGAYIHDR